MTAWRGIRYRPDVGWELRCEACAEDHEQRYWPLTHEFWDPNRGMSRCRACWTARHRTARKEREWDRRRNENRLRYKREWAARKRQQEREDEGRRRYERKAA